MDSKDLADEIHALRSEVENIRQHIPPKWVAWLFGALILAVLSWGTWMTVNAIRLEESHRSIQHQIADHRSLPIHPGAAGQLIIIRSLVADLRTEVKVLDTKVEKLRDIHIKESQK